MKCIIILCTLAVLATADDKYSTENDDFDIEALVGNPDALKTYLKCFNDEGPCDEAATDFKDDIPDAVSDACKKCTDKQKHIFKRFLETIKEKEPEGFKAFQQKYDPQNKNIAALEAAIASA